MKTFKQVAIGEKEAPNALVDNEESVLAEVLRRTGFKVEDEIFRGLYYFKKKQVTGSVIYKGEYRKGPAVLKLQGLKLEAGETEIIEIFEKQNRSKKVHAPRIFAKEKWRPERGYGFIVEEYVDAPHIYNFPFATKKQMLEWGRFYEEYRTKAITRPWIREPKVDTLAATIQGVSNWARNAELEKRIKLEDYAPYLIRFYDLASKYGRGFPISFMHRELTNEHVFKLHNGTYRVFSNILWGYRLQWSELSYNVWRSLLAIRDNSYSFGDLKKYVEDWVEVYKRIPITKKDKDFEQKIYYLLLERTLGILVGDLGFGNTWGKPENKKYLRHMIELHQQLFDYLAQKLETKYPKTAEAQIYVLKRKG